MNTTTAANLTEGQTFTDHMGHTHTVTRTEGGKANGAGVYVFVEGQGYPEFYLNGEVVEVIPTPARVAPVAAPRTTGRRGGSSKNRFYCASVYAYKRNGNMRKFNYTSWDNMNAGIDRLIAKGYIIHTYA